MVDVGVEEAVGDDADGGVWVADVVGIEVGPGVSVAVREGAAVGLDVGKVVSVGCDWLQATESSNSVSNTTIGRNSLLLILLGRLVVRLLSDSLSAKVNTAVSHGSALVPMAVDMLAGVAVELSERHLGRRSSEDARSGDR